MKILLLITFLVLSSCTFANCQNINSQPETIECNQAKNSLLEQKLKKLISEHEIFFAEKNETLLLESFKQANLAWESYRKLHCESISYIYTSGSLYTYSYTLCDNDLIKQRINQMTTSYQDTVSILKEGSP